MTTYIYPGNRYSAGAKALAKAMGIKRLKHDSNRHPRLGTIINWGCANYADWPIRFAGLPVINPPAVVAVSANKLSFFEAMKEVKWNDKRICPAHFLTKEEARDYLRKNGGAIVCHTILNGAGGVGIIIAEEEAALVDCRLYVRYVPKSTEYRVHVKDGNVLFFQEKARKLDVEDPNWKVRNHENGFIYKRQGVEPPECVLEVAKVCMANLALDFGAVDVIYNAKAQRAYVLEVNSAPGLEGQSVLDYAKAFSGEKND